MKDNNLRRKRIRLRSWDYRSPGWYFVTICTRTKENFFGNVMEDEVQLSPIGDRARNYWVAIKSHFQFIELDDFLVMPNHIHGILILNSEGSEMSKSHRPSVSPQPGRRPSVIPKPKSLSAIIRSYKSSVTRWARSNGFPSFAWQPRFYDHIIRDDADLHRIRRYIGENPSKWELDEYTIPENSQSI